MYLYIHAYTHIHTHTQRERDRDRDRDTERQRESCIRKEEARNFVGSWDMRGVARRKGLEGNSVIFSY